MTHHSFISNFKKLAPFFYGVLLVFLMVAFVNSIIDRKGLYFKNHMMQHIYQKYAYDLLHSRSPVPIKENERLIKYYLGSFSGSSVYILGSSRALKINRDFLKEQEVTNLAVSGASFEDFLLILGMLLEKKNPPQTIYLVIDPWFFSKDADIRYLELLDFYKKSLSTFNFIYEGSKYHLLKEKVKNIINKQYLYYNLSSLKLKKEIDNKTSSTEQTYNADGTTNDPEKYEESAPKPESKKIDPQFEYKLDYISITPSTVKKFCEAIRIAQEKGIQFVFFVLPYHSSIHEKQYADIKGKLILFYDALKKISKVLNTPLLGNMLPDAYNLKNEDYYDGIHLRQSGLKKVFHLNETQ